MKIRKLHIEKYKVFDEATFDFVDKEGNTLDTIVLAGVNGCGKTSVLELIKEIINGCKMERMKIIQNLNTEIEISSSFKKKWEDREELELPEGVKERMALASMVNDDTFLLNIAFPPASSSENLNIRSDARTKLSFFIEEGYVAYFPANENSYEGAKVQQFHINNHQKNMEESLLKSVLNDVFRNKQLSPYQTLQSAVQKVNYLLSDFKLNTKLADFEQEQMVFESLNGEKIYFNDLSNGEKQLYFRAISLYQLDINDGIILVDEPEDSLHPTWQKAIITLYQKIGKNNQVIVATHSPHIMASVKPESLFLLHIQEGENGRKVQILNMEKEGKHSKGVEPNRILKEIMEVEMLRDFETQKEIDKLTELLNIQDFEKTETTELIMQLTIDLGKQDPFIMKVNHQILMLNRQKEKLSHAPY